jgi:hypothetical protein
MLRRCRRGGDDCYHCCGDDGPDHVPVPSMTGIHADLALWPQREAFAVRMRRNSGRIASPRVITAVFRLPHFEWRKCWPCRKSYIERSRFAALLRSVGDLVIEVAGFMIAAELAQRRLV